MKKELIFLSGIMLACACQSRFEKYNSFVRSWVGKSEAELIETWGAPDQMQTIGPNRQIFVYIKERQVRLNETETPSQYLGADSAYPNNAFAQTLDYYCQTTFTTQDDIIVDYAVAGDGCYL